MEDETGFTATVPATTRGAIGVLRGLLVGAISLVSRRRVWGRFAVSASAQKTLVPTVPKPSRAAKVRSIAGLPLSTHDAHIFLNLRGREG